MQPRIVAFEEIGLEGIALRAHTGQTQGAPGPFRALRDAVLTGSGRTAAAGAALLVVGRNRAHALAQHLLQRRRTTVLLQKVAERLVGQFLNGRHAVLGELVERMPGLDVEGDALPHALIVPARHAARLRLRRLGALRLTRLRNSISNSSVNCDGSKCPAIISRMCKVRSIISWEILGLGSRRTFTKCASLTADHGLAN